MNLEIARFCVNVPLFVLPEPVYISETTLASLKPACSTLRPLADSGRRDSVVAGPPPRSLTCWVYNAKKQS